jgi:oxygen-dependent protoporphyrinogen oxidase
VLTQDVSVGDYVGARLGAAVVDRLVEPLLGGVYAGHARRLSLQATMPVLWARATRGESLVGAPGAHPASTTPGGGTQAPRPPFTGLRGGVGRLAELVADEVARRGATLRTGAVVRDLQRTAAGWRLVVGSAADPEALDADAVLLCVPAAPAARLLAGHAPEAAQALAGVETASSAVVTLAVERSGIGDLPGSGFLVPPVEGRTIKASTFSFRKWAWNGALSDDVVHLRASVGRAREEADLQRDDADLVAVAVAEVGEAIGRPLPRVVDSHVQRWGGGLPQYAVGHVDRVATIRADVGHLPGLEVAGAVYDGVGIPAVVASATRAATATVQHLLTTASRTGDHPA